MENDINEISIKRGDIDYERAELIKSSEDYKTALEDQLTHIKNNMAFWGKRALIIGGALFVSYKLYKWISSDAEDEYNQEELQKPQNQQLAVISPKRESSLIRAIKDQITFFLIAMAREKLKEFLESTEEKTEHADTNDTV
ncbi:hypothetical protein QQ008_21370 [Fulvivirgaceae bacterium BMA10]|uniref:Uncharacterized protein n=1 Tax=Splendidivirga corallicola TaxID=3051826 RepID=A0ABT8KWZ1_9BACT|nr:hypothetical protein [Fulvivirgaceae bacterium BMA10]